MNIKVIYLLNGCWFVVGTGWGCNDAKIFSAPSFWILSEFCLTEMSIQVLWNWDFVPKTNTHMYRRANHKRKQKYMYSACTVILTGWSWCCIWMYGWCVSQLPPPAAASWYAKGMFVWTNAVPCFKANKAILYFSQPSRNCPCRVLAQAWLPLEHYLELHI